MKKNKKNKYLFAISFILILLIGGFVYYILNYKNANSLSLEENKWLDANKYNVIDIAVINDIPILSYDGEGTFFDYINYVSNKHSLKFNIIPYKLDEAVNYDYKLNIVSEASKDDIILAKDNLILVTQDGTIYNDVNKVSNLTIGVLNSDKELIEKYFNNSTIKYVLYDNYLELKNAYAYPTSTTKDTSTDNSTDTNNSESSDSETKERINAVIIPKLLLTKEIIENDYKIAYHFNDFDKYYVLATSNTKELNGILKKSYNLWKESQYQDSYDSNLLKTYYKFKNISDSDQKKLQSKKYAYGFIDYGVYNHLKGKKLSGFSELVLKKFSNFSGLIIKYSKYNSISKLIKDYNDGKIDFAMNIFDEELVKDSYKTVGVFNKKLVVITDKENNAVIDNLYSLRGKEVLTIKDSYLEKFLIGNDIKVKLYNNIKDLTSDFTSEDIIIVDLDNYNYYKTSAFKNVKINYILSVDDSYNFVINNKEDNALFEKIFDFYLNYNSMNELISKNYDSVAYENINIVYILIFIIIALSIYVIIDFSNHVKTLIKKINKGAKVNLTKEEKIKYIDQLTSLKNRAYLNSRIEMWDSSEIYPQAIIIIDLNNISYINDNYGREEGDKVIAEAANILIQHQLQNSEIIRTDGNEFLVYLVGYNEKQIISYLRKLNKEFKGLSHGFGAASGYSIIMDAIKSFDDAVNEATIDMKNNKEDIDY